MADPHSFSPSVSAPHDADVLRDYCARGGSVILIGMSGVGKTTVGRRLAYLHDLDFIDTDAEIEKTAGISIGEIFRAEGEAGFREVEKRVIRRVLQERSGSVIATGGGAYLDEELRRDMRRAGVSVWMKAPPSVLVRRVRRLDHRPLLQTGDPFRILTELLRVREPFYAEADVTVDTGRSSFSRDRTVARVLRVIVGFLRSDRRGESDGLQMISVMPGAIGPGRGYHVSVGSGQLAQAGRVLANLYPRQKHTCIVTDAHVGALYREPLARALQQAGISADVCTLPAGEQSKSWTQLQAVCEALLQAGIERGQAVIALGGGVIGDLTGTAAGLVRRGIGVLQIPTTLLAQVDSSVGGKTGINTPSGKNMVGLFHRPDAVLIDPDTLRTLPARHLRAGYAEVLKYALLGDRDFFHRLQHQGPELIAGDTRHLSDIIARCVGMKAGIVARDEHEHGERALLNLGHTFGHAFEAEAGYNDDVLLHGEAVAAGMACAFRLATRLGMCPPEDTAAVIEHLQATGLPHTPGVLPFAIHPGRLLERMRQDKKNRDGRLVLILPGGIGRAYICNEVREADITDILATD